MMKVDFINSVSFKSDYSTNLLENAKPVEKPVAESIEDDRFVKLEQELNKLKEEQQNIKTLVKQTKSFKDSVKSGIANIWKFFSVFGTMAYAAAKGTLYGIAAGTAVLLSAIALRSPKFVKAEGFKAIFTHPFKAAGKVGTTIAALGTVGTLAGFLVAGKLEANENSSVIEHKMDVAHIND